MKAVILTAQSSLKLMPFSKTRHKSMIHITGSCILEKTVSDLALAGLKELIVVVNHHQNQIRNHFLTGGRFGVNITYLEQKEPDGIGSAVALCEPLLGREPFLLVYGDIITASDHFRRILGDREETGDGYLTAVTHPEFELHDCGSVYINHEMKITKLLEKRRVEQSQNYVLAGCHILDGTFFDVLRANEGHMENALKHCIARGVLNASVWEGDWIDLEYPWHILEANRFMMKAFSKVEIPASCSVDPNASIQGPVVLGERVVVRAGAVIDGPCYVGSDTFIGNHCLLRDHVSIGERSTIGFGTEVKNSVFFGNTSVGRLSFIGDSVVGENVEIGSGTITINNHSDKRPIVYRTERKNIAVKRRKLGAFIGDGSKIGSNHTLAPASSIEAGTVVDDNFTLVRGGTA